MTTFSVANPACIHNGDGHEIRAEITVDGVTTMAQLPVDEHMEPSAIIALFEAQLARVYQP